MADETNDNHCSARAIPPDAYGQAAYLLVESLVHVLIEENVISVGKAIEAVKIAHDVRLEVAHETDDASDTMVGSVELLKSLARTLRADQTDLII